MILQSCVLIATEKLFKNMYVSSNTLQLYNSQFSDSISILESVNNATVLM